MKFIYIMFICLHTILFSSFFEEEDLNHYYHVNVITGHLDLNFEDLSLNGPVPFSINRSYSSAGALERSEDDLDLLLKRMRSSGWMFQGGWGILPHINLLMQPDLCHYCHKAFLTEKNSTTLVPYTFYKQKEGISYLKPYLQTAKVSGNLSARKQSKHNVLKIGQDSAILYLPDLTERHYSGNIEGGESYWRLDFEILPSKHRLVYSYSKDWRRPGKLEKIELQNPAGSKIFASIQFDHSSFDEDRQLHVATSYGKKISYQMGPDFKERVYLQNATSALRGKETFIYHPGRRGIGARVSAMKVEEREQFRIEYYLPPTKKKAKKWAQKPRKHQQGDKVRSLLFPDPQTGEFIEVASFVYHNDYTEVIDNEGVSTRYYHDGAKLLSVEYRDCKGELYSKIGFDWKDNHLRSKMLLDNNNHIIYSKSFKYDEAGNIINERWEPHQSLTPPLERKFTYTKLRLVEREEEIDGLTYEYTYFHKTDLPTRKLTLHNKKILLREFWFYNEDHLLVCHVIDDGTTPNPENLTHVSERKIETFNLDSETGLCTHYTQAYLDKETLAEKIFLKHSYTYNDQRELITETINDFYTLYYEYDSSGHLIKKTTPLGRENTYYYDPYGNLITSKEVKSPMKHFTYDFANRPIKCCEANKITQSLYDMKGRLIEQTDGWGNITMQRYDCFGRCIQTILPQTFDENGIIYAPILESAYDIQNNLISSTNPKGEIIQTKYNHLRKPILIQYPDQSELNHIYNKDGTIAKTILADQTEIHFTYDPFQRMTNKRIVSPQGEALSEEHWVYNSFHLLSYTNPEGLTTNYAYDGMGRKISEQAQDRLTTYTYDHLGFLEKISTGAITNVKNHNFEGEIIEQWEEDSYGKIENHMLFFYDDEGRKVKAHRMTSQGIAEDTFEYDEWGRLLVHIDPQNEKKVFIYAYVYNNLDQLIEQRTTLDPLGNATVETFNANGQLTLIRKLDSNGQTVGHEEFYYDRAGNKAKRIVTIFDTTKPIRTHTTTWTHNSRGLVIEEIEEGKKQTLFSYDPKGRLIQKTLPNKTTLVHQYDNLDRLVKLKSSDRTIHYTYSYGKGCQPITATDRIHNNKWIRTYNLFGQLEAEILPNNFVTLWTYDSLGRCTGITLPDQSMVKYVYSDKHLERVERYGKNQDFVYAHSYTDYDSNGHVIKENLIYNLGIITTDHDLLERPYQCITPWHKASISYGPSGLVTKTDNSFFGSKDFKYDALNQLIKEKNRNYRFDSLGNPLNASVNSLNQILHTSSCRCMYNDIGNPWRKVDSENTITYSYDPLNRLISLQVEGQKQVHYTYDPFGRLYTKEISQKPSSYFFGKDQWDRTFSYYLYDQNCEIGILDRHGFIRELKVSGLGILGDIGATIALELDSKIYAPLHDFTGNIIALISEEGTVVEKNDLDAFGHNLPITPSINPWRFHSKRTEEHLVFFGERFYDPNLARWLTPDPAGSIESPNLYLFVLNSPLNRLDLFGLYSEDFRTEVPISSLIDNSCSYAECKVYYRELQADWVIYSNNFHRLQFSPEELNAGKIDILHHFNDLFEKEGFGIGLITYQNGIGNAFTDLKATGDTVAKHMPQDGLFIAMYTPGKGLYEDVKSVRKERNRVEETPEVVLSRQASIAISETLGKISPKIFWSHIAHSRASLIGCYAIEGMSDEEQRMIRDNMIWISMGGAEPLEKKFALDSINVYSKKDYATGQAGLRYQNKQKHLPPSQQPYNIMFVESISSKNEQGFFGDHGIMGKTYKTSVEENMADGYAKFGIYKGKR